MQRRSSAVAGLVLGLVLVVPRAIAATYTGAGAVIPDAASLEGPPGIATSDIVVPDAIAIQTLMVTVGGLTHTWCGDVTISIAHVESGLTRTLVSRIGLPTNPPPNSFGDSSNYGGDYDFADPFTTNIWTVAASGGSQFVITPGGYFATAPGTGVPVSILAVFGGANAAGTWRLTVSDAAAGDVGAFTGWTLEITGGEFDPCPATGSCFAPHLTPGCDNDACCTTVCGVDASCCDRGWDVACVDAALGTCGGCGSPAAGECCTAHAGAGCDKFDCCGAVCAVDPSCCATQWDADCVVVAQGITGCGCIVPPVCGDAGTGDCCTAHAGPLCDNAPCCNAVCAVDPTCCSAQWDADCVAAAQAVPGCGCIVPPACGDAGTGDCCTAHAGPFCANMSCCQAVCAADPSCCSAQWDADCVTTAQGVAACGCPPPPPVCPGVACCFSAAATKGCNNVVCCQQVCASDPFCCEVAWDSGCVLGAYAICCPGDFNGNGKVDGADLGELLSSIGQVKPDADFNCDGIINGSDLGIFLSNWGPCGGG